MEFRKKDLKRWTLQERCNKGANRGFSKWNPGSLSAWLKGLNVEVILVSGFMNSGIRITSNWFIFLDHFNIKIFASPAGWQDFISKNLLFLIQNNALFLRWGKTRSNKQREIKRVVIETTGVCDVTLHLWHDVTSFAIHLTNRSFFQDALVEYIGVCTDTNKQTKEERKKEVTNDSWMGQCSCVELTKVYWHP